MQRRILNILIIKLSLLIISINNVNIIVLKRNSFYYSDKYFMNKFAEISPSLAQFYNKVPDRDTFENNRKFILSI